MTQAKPLLTDRFTEAVAMAQRLHRRDLRKGTSIPYLAHLLSVSALVLEHGGTEDQAIAALLHDAAEDQGGQTLIDKIRVAFGDTVADIVAACSDSFAADSTNKEAWWPRKVRYLDHLKEVSAEALLVSAADKLHNARSTLDDYRADGETVWRKFKIDAGRGGSLWYYRCLVEIYRTRPDGGELFVRLVDELDRTVDAICDLAHFSENELEAARRKEAETRANANVLENNLWRFEQHHPDEFDQALSEIHAVRKQTHWMWYIFPQLATLGRSDIAREYGITTVAEAEAYLRHPVLGRDYALIASAVLHQLDRSVGLTSLMGSPDDLKLISSVTLFGGVARKLEGPAFADLAKVCAAVLARATGQGFKQCATTNSFLNADS